eukprot:TRINITY_DN1033_c0_g2_i1.p1 TRINITY_DN1033_c0_g2~~TRINITY_DN1033_c0_g2_i1.p1  ORF type:complete len:490 (+),score=55.76 TRINITY_DN1033_c0_g2_i1:674-2143(+)
MKPPLYFILLLRTFAALISNSWHVPDETWQSTEIAHGLAFGSSHQTWEWRTGAQIRSYLHPATLFTPLFILIKSLGIRDPYAYIISPRILQGFISFIGDIYLLKSLKLISLKENERKTFMMLYFGNVYMNFCASRPLINALETALSNGALYLYFLPNATSALVSLLALGVCVRPTLALFWAPMALFYLYRLRETCPTIMNRIGKALIALCVVFTSVFFFESACYGNWTFPPLNFLVWNVFHGVGSFYGRNPSHWYLSNASLALLNIAILPVILFLFFFSSKWKIQRNIRSLLFSSLFCIAGFSLLEHKEHRFILHILPVLLIFGALGLAKMKWKGVFLSIYIPLNALAFLYLSLFHQSGTTRLIYPYLSQEISSSGEKVVMLLMPCHSTPDQSYLHRPDVTLRFLSCEPFDPFEEAEVFYEDPHHWLSRNNEPLSDYIVIFDSLEETLRGYLREEGYTSRKKLFHSHFPEGRIGSYVLVYGRNESTKKM